MAKAKVSAGFKLSDSFVGKVDKIFQHTDVLLAIGVIGIVMVLLFPVPKILLDFLLSISITSGILILMVSLFINKSLELSSFPTILLITALLRLSLNIASTRLILSSGHGGTGAAGKIIEAFGGFIMSGNIVIGIIVFSILTIINFIVITKGSGRIAEVAARFSLDAMPGKQMAIDADLSAGIIDEETAKARRKELEDESTFYGAMDGANKFVRGDAIAGILITFINFIGGIVIGVIEKDMSFSSALKTYTILTIGDGLVSQIPALIISLSTGLVVSKSGNVGSTDKAIFGQLGKYPVALLISATILLLMGLMPGIPLLPFLFLAGLIGGISYVTNSDIFKKLKESDKAKENAAKAAESAPEAPSPDSDEAIIDSIKIEHIRIELGYSLLSLVNYAKGIKLTDQIKSLRKQIAKDLGFIIPSVRIQDNMQLPNDHYIIYVKEIKCGEGIIKPDKIMVMDPKGGEIDFAGDRVLEPAFNLPAVWVDENLREEAIIRNYTVVEPITVITTHLTEIIKDNITDLLTYVETQKLIDGMPDEHRKLVGDIIPSQLTVSGIQKILQNLLNEMISIRDLPTILEAIAEICRSTKSLVLITEYVRSRLARQISQTLMNHEGVIPVVSLSPAWEQAFMESLAGAGEDKTLTMPPSKIQEFVALTKQVFDDLAAKGEMPCLLTSPQNRPYIRSIIERFRPITPVISQAEIHSKVKVKTLGQI
ncbi:MAG: flagellar biosynthesis protein FlhA [Alphaproteobacteria bacterium]|nr:flagellar biosynthesis protein FlhA [Alphaproteobacteria bacterium]OJV16358.1 MAG: flagellar biosynthesis protein FlhA [Alphaproteobacteria bacterium 33-17]